MIGLSMPSHNETQQKLNILCSELQRNNGYKAREEIDRILALLKDDRKRLEHYGFKVYSQGDEDGIIEEIFNRIGIKKGRFCEIGVENGLECNSLYLIHKGWTGVWIEGNQNQRQSIEIKFQSIIPSRLKLAIGMITAENINSIFQQIGIGNEELDFLSIDIDGNDIYLFENLTIKPKVICIEYNSKFPGNISKKATYNLTRGGWSGTDYMGSSLKSLRETASIKNYRLVGTNITGTNAFFVRNDLTKNLFTEDDSSEYLYNPPRYYLIWDHFHYIGHRADFGPYEDLNLPL
jgi:hypothetical protein